MIAKTYRLTTAIKANVGIAVNGKPVVIFFQNGVMGEHRKGGYATVTNEDEQLALEADPRFNTIYRLEGEKEIKEPSAKAVKVEKMPEGGIFDGVTNSQAAKKKLMEIFTDLKHSDLPNKEAILNFAKQHEITFPDWQL